MLSSFSLVGVYISEYPDFIAHTVFHSIGVSGPWDKSSTFHLLNLLQFSADWRSAGRLATIRLRECRRCEGRCERRKSNHLARRALRGSKAQDVHVLTQYRPSNMISNDLSVSVSSRYRDRSSGKVEVCRGIVNLRTAGFSRRVKLEPKKTGCSRRLRDSGHFIFCGTYKGSLLPSKNPSTV